VAKAAAKVDRTLTGQAELATRLVVAEATIRLKSDEDARPVFGV